MAEFLIEHGADVEVPKNDGCTPFQLTCMDERSKVAELLKTSAMDVGLSWAYT
jgi:hypothetical protein